MKFRKITALLLVLCMMLSLSISAFAASDTIASGTIPDSKIKWELDSHGWLTISGSGDIADFSKEKESNDGTDHTTAPWSRYWGEITAVVIESGVIEIGVSAFYGCIGLASVTIPDGVTEIGTSAFYGCCRLTGVVIPESVTSIGKSAFEACSGLTSITIPDGVAVIDDSAFYDCLGLTSVTIPGSVTSMGKEVRSSIRPG